MGSAASSPARFGRSLGSQNIFKFYLTSNFSKAVKSIIWLVSKINEKKEEYLLLFIGIRIQIE